jgi:tetratricopeptide (TPR) repeat protein
MEDDPRSLFLQHIPVVVLAMLFGVLWLSSSGHAQDNTAIDLAKKPCVTASSPCPLDFAVIPDSLMPQVIKAKQLFEGGDFTGAQKELESLRAAQPESRIILYDLALVSLRQGQRDQALAYQQEALRGVMHPYQRRALDELGEEILYGRGMTDKMSLSLADVLPAPVGSSRDPAERADAEINTVCPNVKQRHAEMIDNPSGVFNLAQCAEYEGRLEEADKFYKQYLEMAPEALDRDSVALRVSEIDTFNGLDVSSPARQMYHAGVRALMTGDFNAANQLFAALSSGGPGSRVGLLQSGVLALLAGRHSQAEKYLGNLLDQETNTDMRDYIGHLLKTEGAGDNEFIAGIKEVLKFIQEYDFVQASEAIQKPLRIYPLSPAVNALAAFIALNTNNYPAARRAMDNLWAQGQPVFFYAAVKSSSQKQEMVYRVQISPDKVVLAPLRAGAKMAELVERMQEGKPQDTTETTSAGSVVAFTKAEITEIHSTGSELEMKTSKGEWKITPQVAFVKPREGWPARAFMNDYADLFATYLGLANVELGAESTDSADRWRLIARIALAALAAYSQSGGTNLQFMHGTLKAVVAAGALAAATNASVNEYKLYQATLSNTLNRFLFRPLISSGPAVTFMIPEHSNQSPPTVNSAVTVQNGDELLVQYSKSVSKNEKGSAGFATVHLNKEQIRLQDTKPDGPTIVVSCADIAKTLRATETHKESRDGRITTSDTLTPWTIESTYALMMYGSRAEDPVVEIMFNSELRRAEVQTTIESNCGVSDLPEEVTVFIPTSSGKQWSDLFHAKFPHMGDRKSVAFPSCDDITSIQMSKTEKGEVYLVMRTNKKGKKGLVYGKQVNSEREINVRARDVQSALRVGSKLAADCGVPFR